MCRYRWFLAMALLSLELWVIKDLAIPLVIILGVKTKLFYWFYLRFLWSFG